MSVDLLCDTMYGKDNDIKDILANGKCRGSCGAAIVVKNCIAKTYGSVDLSVRSIPQGTLIQVFANHDSVRFSPLIETSCQLDKACLICNNNDIALVPHKIWGALLPLTTDLRLYIAQKAALADSLSLIENGSTVNIFDDKNDVVAEAIVQFKFCVTFPPKPGIYYGVKFQESPDVCNKLRKSLSIIENVTDECDAFIDLRRFFSSRREETTSNDVFISSNYSITSEKDCMTSHQGAITKSASHHSLRPVTVDDTLSTRQVSTSDLTPKVKSFSNSQKHVINNDIVTYPAKAHTTFRSLDLSSNVDRRLVRDRGCASLDSGDGSHHQDGDQRDLGDLCVGSLVEFSKRYDIEPFFGVIRWIGNSSSSGQLIAGIELEEEFEENFDAHGKFDCPPYKAYFVELSKCRRDSRFQESSRRQSILKTNFAGQKDCPVVEGVIQPIASNLKDICGKYRGIQGHNNSCYLDATLFAMFAFTSAFDSVIYRPAHESDHPRYKEVQRVLRDEIVNPLRKNLYVSAERVMKLRKLLDQLSSVTGLTSEEKDPEEFMNSLLAQILKAEPFLQLNSGQEAFYYQLFVEKDENVSVPTVQQLLEQSFRTSDIKLKQLPACFIVQMPRFGKSFKMYPRIFPSLTIDVTDLIDNSPRQCTVCGKLAEYECKECFVSGTSEGLEGSSFCKMCMATAHQHPLRSRHTASRLTVPLDCHDLLQAGTGAVPRLFMDLFAVVCIQTSHYVAFLNTDHGWVFFDSMADRKGEQNGFNIPEIVHCSEFSSWLSEEGRNVTLMQDERDLPILMKRFLCDAYICMYQSPQVIMYR